MKYLASCREENEMKILQRKAGIFRMWIETKKENDRG
jgi:hypothetical protein